MPLLSDIKGKVVLRYRIDLQEFLHVGAGEEMNTSSHLLHLQVSDNPVLVRRNGKPYIPGSSLKGLFRAHVQRILISLQHVLNKMGFTSWNTTTPPFDEMFKIIKEHDILTDEDVGKKFIHAMNDDVKIQYLQQIGLIDRLFGHSGLASLLIFNDALPLEEKPHIILRRHVKIDSSRDRAESGRLFDVEGVSREQSFEGSIVFTVSSDPFYQPANVIFYHCLWLPIMRGEMELLIGGQKSRGYGFTKMIPLVGEFRSIECDVLGTAPIIYKPSDDVTQIKSSLLIH